MDLLVCPIICYLCLAALQGDSADAFPSNGDVDTILDDIGGRGSGIQNLDFVPLSSCQAIREHAPADFEPRSGLYTIHPDESGEFVVYCSMLVGVEGWTVIQRRVDAEENFDKSWREYRSGFGAFTQSFWLGLEKIKRITDSATHQLYVGIESPNCGRRWAMYESFRLSAEAGGFRLSIGDYNPSSTLCDSLSAHNGARFSTKGREAQGTVGCKADYSSGWWFNECSHSKVNLNGLMMEKYDGPEYLSQLTAESIWMDLGDIVCVVEKVVMAVRAVD